MITVNDVTDWHLMVPGSGMSFLNKNPRACTIDFNVAGTASIYITLHERDRDGVTIPEKEPVLLAHVTGRETVKFAVPGPYTILSATEDVDVFVLSRDSSKVHRVAIDEEVFTTLHEPRTRDPHLEKVIAQMNRGIERRLASQQAQFEREIARERENAAAAAAAAITGGTGNGGKPKAPTEPAPPSGGDGDTGGDDGPVQE